MAYGSYTILAASTVPVDCGANGATVTNVSSTTVYYRDESPVSFSQSLYDGSIAPSASVTLTGTTYLHVRAGFDPAVVVVSAVAGSGSGVAKSGDTMTGELVLPDVSASGLTGAVAGARFVGATASGAPTSGTFLVGDYVVSRVGNMHVCTVSGSPGTWVDVGSGRELGYAEITSNFTQAASGLNTVYDVTGLSVTATVGTRPIFVQVYLPQLYGTAATAMALRIYEGATILQISTLTVSSASSGDGVTAQVRLAPSAGSHTYKASVVRTAASASDINVTAASIAPAFIRVVEG